MSRKEYIITKVIHAIAALLLLTMAISFFYIAVVPMDDNEKSIRGILVIPAAILTLASLLPILSFFLLKERHKKGLQYTMAAISAFFMLFILYLSITQ